MALATGDVVDVVEKNESGQPPHPAWTSLPWCPGPRPQAPTKALPPAESSPGPPPRLAHSGAPAPSGALTILPTRGGAGVGGGAGGHHPLSESAALGICTHSGP